MGIRYIQKTKDCYDVSVNGNVVGEVCYSTWHGGLWLSSHDNFIKEFASMEEAGSALTARLNESFAA
jgi:hypothetical protein